MLNIAVNSDKDGIISFCRRFPLGCKISSKVSAYGFEYDFFKVWFSRNGSDISAVIAQFENEVTIVADDNADFEELSSFCQLNGFENGCCQSEVLGKLGLAPKAEKQMFVYEKPSGNNTGFIDAHGDLRQAYSIISKSIPNSFSPDENAYLSFLSDFTFRQRRGSARIKTYSENGKVVSCALTSAETDNTAIISGVACDESQRGKGIGKMTVQCLADELLREGKTVYVIALNDGAGEFYNKIGFKKITDVCFF